jgi:hypothetical protein
MQSLHHRAFGIRRDSVIREIIALLLFPGTLGVDSGLFSINEIC